VVYLDALYVKMRHEGRVENRAVYVAIGIDLEGRKEVLGLWKNGNRRTVNSHCCDQRDRVSRNPSITHR